MNPEKKRVAKKATTLEKSTTDADEDDWNKSPIRTLTGGRDAPVAVLFFSYQELRRLAFILSEYFKPTRVHDTKDYLASIL